MGPIYFLSGRNTASNKALEALGLGYLLDGQAGVTYAPVAHSGPDGKGGVMFTLPDAEGNCPSVADLARRAKFQPLPGFDDSTRRRGDAETRGGKGSEPQQDGAEGAARSPRHRVAASPRHLVWFGWDPAAPPTPEDLARREPFPGHPVRLADGQDWLVPAARLFGGGTCFPTRLAWDGSRWTRGQVIERYRELYDAAGKFWDLFQGIIADIVKEGRTDITLQDEGCIGAQALACNYRIGPGEISLLGLFTDETEVEVIKALIDWPAVEAKAGSSRAGLTAAWRKGLLPDYRPTVADVAGTEHPQAVGGRQ